MNNSEMRGSVAKWVNEFCDMFSVQIPNHDQLCNYLANRIEENLVVENDPDVLMVRKDGKLQPARVINEEKGFDFQKNLDRRSRSRSSHCSTTRRPFLYDDDLC